jgi:FlaG/FlaF family flagellin (archaellin)
MYTSTFRRKSKRKGVSDIVGNILILSITVTLFSTLFFWVGTLPTPTPSISTIFSASLTYDRTNSYITAISITDLGGSPLYNQSTIIFISYSNSPQYNSEYFISSGTTANPWLPGTTWYISLKNQVPLPTTVTISIVDTSKNLLVWSNQLPAIYVPIPPIIKAEGTIPSGNIAINSQFGVWAQVYDQNEPISSVYASIPSLSTTPISMTFNSNLQEYITTSQFTAPSTPQTVTAEVVAINAANQKSVAYFQITFIVPFLGQANMVWGQQSLGWSWNLFQGPALDKLCGLYIFDIYAGSGVTISVGGEVAVYQDREYNALDIWFIINSEAINIGTAPAQNVKVYINGSSTSSMGYVGNFSYYDSYTDIAPLGRTTFTGDVQMIVPTGYGHGQVYMTMVIKYQTYGPTGSLQWYTISEYPYIYGYNIC